MICQAASPAWDAKMSPSAYFLDALLQRLITAFEASVLVKHLGALTREMMKDLSRDSMAGCFNLHIPQLVALLTCPSTTVKSYLVSIFEIIWSLNESEMDILRDTFGTRTPLSSESVQKGSDFFFFFAPSAQTKVEPRNRKELQKAHFEQIAKVLQAISTSSTLGSLSGRLSADAKLLQHESTGSCLVLTTTTKINVNSVVEVANTRLPLLLSGGTGVGKSATIAEAASRSGKTLVRFNMSSRVTIDDLLGKVGFAKDANGQECFSFSMGPFAKAFHEGCWLLLDELNLAQDNVLQCIESAIDTGFLVRYLKQKTTKSSLP
jgi:hypothetical protein